MFDNIVIALKEGLPHDRLLGLGTSVAREGAKIHLVTLVRVGTDEDEPKRLAAVGEYLEQRAGQLRERGFDATWERGLVVVAAAADVLQVVSSRSADLVVIGLAKRTRVGKALMGSDAQRIMMGAPCPVLVTQLYRD